MENILVVEDTESLREVLSTVLGCEGYNVTTAATAEEALQLFKQNDFQLVLTDLKLPNKSGLDLLKESKVLNHIVPVVVMTAYGNIDIAVQAMKHGATDFVTKPFDPGSLCELVKQLIEHRRIIDRSAADGRRKGVRRIVTQSENMEAVLHQARRVAPLSTSVLILGESGTGKDLLARYIHDLSAAAERPFVAVNCASTPGDLLESEFFGHEAGSFTGATQRRIGLFEVADGGTIFLDEIGDMPAKLQVKLLRTLQESEIKRIGSNEIHKINVRVISATNCNIDEQLKNGRFRSDLYYRLGVLVLEIPPLRQRPADIPLLANYFAKCFSSEMNCEPRQITPEAMRRLENYEWPGNIRELENVIERASIFAKGPITVDSIELGKQTLGEQSAKKRLPEIAAVAVKAAEVEAILQAMEETRGNKSKAAVMLGVSYKTLLNKFKEYGLETSLGKVAAEPEG